MPERTPASRILAVDRRQALRLAASGAALAGLAQRGAHARQGATPAPAGTPPVTGNAVPDLAAFDDVMLEALAAWDLPGAQLALARGGDVLLNRGYGYADREAGEPVEPHSLFRIASTSKPITAVAILQLVEAGEIGLDTPVFPLLALQPPPNAPRDPRLDSVTVGQLLTHSGGWNSALGVDPQYLPWPAVASHAFGAESPAEGETIIRLMLAQPLDFDPGTLSAYSNFGFNVLGRVIEHLSGMPYEQYVRERVLAPAGITAMQIGGTRLEERVEDEVRYYGPAGQEPRLSVYPGEGYVPVGYGSFSVRGLDAHGGWIASAHDLVRFALAIDGRRGEPLLGADTVALMETSPRPPSAATGAGNAETALGLGWNSVAVEGGHEWSHAGALEGSNCSWLVRTPDGTALAFVANTLPEDFGGFFGALIPALQGLLAELPPA